MSLPRYDDGGYLEPDGVRALSQDDNKPYTALNGPNSGRTAQVLPPTDSSGYDDVRVRARPETSGSPRSTSASCTRLIPALIVVLLLANTAAVCYLLYKVETAPAPQQVGETQPLVNRSDSESSSSKEDDDDVVVAFYARTGDQSGVDNEDGVIKFDDVRMNVGDGYDCDCGKFSAPVGGVYSFGYEVMASSDCGEGGRVCVSLVRDDEVLSVSCSAYGSSAGTAVALELEADNCVWVAVRDDAPCRAVHAGHFNQFSGHLVSRNTDS